MRDEAAAWSRQWLAEVGDWVRSVVAGHGGDVLGEPQEHETRPWSTVWTVTTDRGRVWFKEGEPASRTEPAVHQALARIAPKFVDPPLGVNSSRGWTLTDDGGPTVADSGPAGSRGVFPETLKALLIDYAALQRATMSRRAELASAGLPSMPPEGAARTAADQARFMGALPPSDPRHLTDAQVQSVLASGPALTAAANVLIEGPVPLAFDHADLFPRNVFLPRAAGKAYRFFDFAESVWAHPFSSLVMLIPELQHRWRIVNAQAVDCRDPRIGAILDAYLTCWTDLAPLSHLRVLAAAALRIAPLHRSTPWLRTLADADTTVVAVHGKTPWAWLEDVTKEVLV